nr:hypothetical protein BCU62_15810 [Enterovibrio norvegicus]
MLDTFKRKQSQLKWIFLYPSTTKRKLEQLKTIFLISSHPFKSREHCSTDIRTFGLKTTFHHSAQSKVWFKDQLSQCIQAGY